MIVADTGAIVALVDAGDRYHEELRALFEEDPGAWILPWAILPEVDHLLLRHVGASAGRAFLRDLAEGAFSVEWGEEADLARARALCERYTALELGLVDGVVIAVAERLRAPAIATLDLRDFGAVSIVGAPRLLPRDRSP
ncbi:MAG TPA: PIN domain-containing protein [Gemmatimonadaceae bacterium]|nr:PIN domain-containing protein [Gemmatimonadaceae bacterium]